MKTCSEGHTYEPSNQRGCPACKKAYHKQYYADNREKSRKACRAWRANNLERAKAMGLSYRRDLKEDVLRHYSGGFPKCSCCGEHRIEFLCLDHEKGGGNKHRAKIKRSGTMFYTWIRKNGFPVGFRVLCHNCNMALGSFGYCPHTREREVAL
jgi:hypothetical protein